MYRYRGVTPPLWLERLLFCHLDGDKWIVATPDGNVCVEDLGSADFEELRVISSIGGRPSDLVDTLHPVQTVPTAAARADGCEQAMALCNAHVPALPLGDGVDTVVAALPSETRKLPRKSSEAEGVLAADKSIDEDALEP